MEREMVKRRRKKGNDGQWRRGTMENGKGDGKASTYREQGHETGIGAMDGGKGDGTASTEKGTMDSGK